MYVHNNRTAIDSQYTGYIQSAIFCVTFLDDVMGRIVDEVMILPYWDTDHHLVQNRTVRVNKQCLTAINKVCTCTCMSKLSTYNSRRDHAEIYVHVCVQRTLLSLLVITC